MKDQYTRVSTVLAQWNHLAHIPPHILENKCRIGTNVHERIETFCAGVALSGEEDEEGYYQSWYEWAQEEGLIRNEGVTAERWYTTEKRYYCDQLLLTGCVDALIFEEGKKKLVDYKTSASVNKKMWRLQGHFYHYLVKKEIPDLDEEFYFLHLHKDGKKASVKKFQWEEEVFKICQHALSTYRYFKG